MTTDSSLLRRRPNSLPEDGPDPSPQRVRPPSGSLNHRPPLWRLGVPKQRRPGVAMTPDRARRDQDQPGRRSLDGEAPGAQLCDRRPRWLAPRRLLRLRVL